MPSKYIEAREEGTPRVDSLLADETISRLRSALAIMLDRQKHEASSLAIAGVPETLAPGVWGRDRGWAGRGPLLILPTSRDRCPDGRPFDPDKEPPFFY